MGCELTVWDCLCKHPLIFCPLQHDHCDYRVPAWSSQMRIKAFHTHSKQRYDKTQPSLTIKSTWNGINKPFYSVMWHLLEWNRIFDEKSKTWLRWALTALGIDCIGHWLHYEMWPELQFCDFISLFTLRHLGFYASALLKVDFFFFSKNAQVKFEICLFWENGSK